MLTKNTKLPSNWSGLLSKAVNTIRVITPVLLYSLLVTSDSWGKALLRLYPGEIPAIWLQYAPLLLCSLGAALTVVLLFRSGFASKAKGKTQWIYLLLITGTILHKALRTDTPTEKWILAFCLLFITVSVLVLAYILSNQKEVDRPTILQPGHPFFPFMQGIVLALSTDLVYSYLKIGRSLFFYLLPYQLTKNWDLVTRDLVTKTLVPTLLIFPLMSYPFAKLYLTKADQGSKGNRFLKRIGSIILYLTCILLAPAILSGTFAKYPGMAIGACILLLLIFPCSWLLSRNLFSMNLYTVSIYRSFDVLLTRMTTQHFWINLPLILLLGLDQIERRNLPLFVASLLVLNLIRKQYAFGLVYLFLICIMIGDLLAEKSKKSIKETQKVEL